MYGRFMVIAYLNGKRQVRYFTTRICAGVVEAIREKLEAQGLRRISVHYMKPDEGGI